MYDSILVATNQFHSAAMREHQSLDRRPTDCPRVRTAEAWADDRSEAVSPSDVRRLLGDPDGGIAWRLDEAGEDPRSTIWSWVVETGGEATLAAGSPADHSYDSVSVPDSDA